MNHCISSIEDGHEKKKVQRIHIVPHSRTFGVHTSSAPRAKVSVLARDVFGCPILWFPCTPVYNERFYLFIIFNPWTFFVEPRTINSVLLKLFWDNFWTEPYFVFSKNSAKTSTTCGRTPQQKSNKMPPKSSNFDCFVRLQCFKEKTMQQNCARSLDVFPDGLTYRFHRQAHVYLFPQHISTAVAHLLKAPLWRTCLRHLYTTVSLVVETDRKHVNKRMQNSGGNGPTAGGLSRPHHKYYFRRDDQTEKLKTWFEPRKKKKKKTWFEPRA